MVPLMTAAQLWGVAQLFFLASFGRSVRWRLAAGAFVAGMSASIAVAVLIEWAWIRWYAGATGKPTADVVEWAGYTFDPFIEELAKVLPVVVICLVVHARRQLGATDLVLLCAATGSGFGLAEGLARFSGSAANAVFSPETGRWSLPTSLSFPQVPGLTATLTSWLPAGVFDSANFGLSGEPVQPNLHLAWSALGGLGVALAVRGARAWRWSGLLLLVFVGLDHATYNFDHSDADASTPLVAVASGPFALIRPALPLYPLLALGAALWLDRSALAYGLRDEDETRLSNRDLARLGAGRPVQWYRICGFVRLRRTLGYAKAAATPGDPALVVLRDALRSGRAVVERPPRWQWTRPSWRRLAGWVGLTVLAVPVCWYLVIGTVPDWAGVQRSLTRMPVFVAVAVLVALAAVWATIRLVLQIGALRAAARRPYGAATAGAVLALLATVAAVAFAAIAVIGVARGGRPTDRPLASHALDALLNMPWWLWLALALLLLLLVAFFAPWLLPHVVFHIGVHILLHVGIHMANDMPHGGSPSPEGSGGEPSEPVPGPAGRRPLRPPNDRHYLNRVRPDSRTHGDENTIIMPGVDVAADMADIVAGRGTWHPRENLYEVNGRRYRVKPNGTLVPLTGPGFVVLSREQYNLLKVMIGADGDLRRAWERVRRDPQLTRENWQAALEVFRYHRSFKGGA